MWPWLIAVMAYGQGPPAGLVHTRDVVCTDAAAARRGDPAVVQCAVEARADGSALHAERWTYAITVPPPAKVIVALVPASTDWSGASTVVVGRSLEPMLLTVTERMVETPDPIDGGTVKQRCLELGATTHVRGKACAEQGALGQPLNLLVDARPAPMETWFPLVAYGPKDPAKAGELKNWFVAMVYLTPEEEPEPVQTLPYTDLPEMIAASVAAQKGEVAVAPPVPAPEPVKDDLGFLDD